MTEFNKCLFKSGILKRIKVLLGGLNNPRRKLEKISRKQRGIKMGGCISEWERVKRGL